MVSMGIMLLTLVLLMWNTQCRLKQLGTFTVFNVYLIDSVADIGYTEHLSNRRELALRTGPPSGCRLNSIPIGFEDKDKRQRH